MTVTAKIPVLALAKRILASVWCAELLPNVKSPLPESIVVSGPIGPQGIVVRQRAHVGKIIRWHEQQRPPRNPADLKPGEDGNWTAYFYLDGARDTRRDVFCQDVMRTLTRAYWYYTHNPTEKDGDLAYRCAWKTVVLLDGYANALPRWLLCDNYGKDYFNAGDKGAFPYGWSETRYGGARQTSEQNGPGFFRHALDVLGGSKAFLDYEAKEHGPSEYEHLFAKEGEAAPANYQLSLYEKLCRNVLMPVRRYQGSVLGKWGQGCPINGTQDYARLTHNREMLRLAAQSMFVYPHKSFFVDGQVVTVVENL